MPTAKERLAVELPARQLLWLNDRAAAHELSDAGKAFRCCVMFQIAAGLERATETPPTTEERVVATSFELAPEQHLWVREQMLRVGGGASQVASEVCASCMRADAQHVFGVIRCKSGAVAESDVACEGARAALAKQRPR
ncbi:hypothetical protein T492DRAFT_838138 [Pavlovales sp. CCMP2436]|nr:hypothetical protein T492DRAFT_838138 [Pavlovales sp. CCMP2436]